MSGSSLPWTSLQTFGNFCLHTKILLCDSSSSRLLLPLRTPSQRAVTKLHFILTTATGNPPCFSCLHVFPPVYLVTLLTLCRALTHLLLLVCTRILCPFLSLFSSCMNTLIMQSLLIFVHNFLVQKTDFLFKKLLALLFWS